MLICWLVLQRLVQPFLRIQPEVLFNEFIESLLLKYQIVHLIGEHGHFTLILANLLLDVQEEVDS